MVSYTLKIRGGCEIDSHGKKAGKGALVQRELAMTIAAAQDQYLITEERRSAVETYKANRIVVVDDQGGAVMKVQTEDRSPTLRAQTHGHVPLVMKALETDRCGSGGDTSGT